MNSNRFLKKKTIITLTSQSQLSDVWKLHAQKQIELVTKSHLTYTWTGWLMNFGF